MPGRLPRPTRTTQPKNDRTNVTGMTWYANHNDLIGGWCITTTNTPASQTDLEHGAIIGDFLSREIAEHITHLHNQHLIGGHA
jgi:hypothetical protein